MEHDERTVPGGALAAALQMVEIVCGRDGGASSGRVSDEIVHSLKIWGHDVVTEAFGTLIYVAARQLQPAADQPDAAGPMELVSAVVTRLQREYPEVLNEHISIAAGILTAAFLDIGPYGWRTSLGPVHPSEHLTWCFTAALLVDLVDTTMQRPGGFAEIVAAILDSDS
ncbi:hypothetical protein ACFV9C_42730 [Kribbella sp. NPDC059898]|uniref:hypothetical protein n=1 Tax=Kribbella sp. NPDC059898 TaxID=3346995 RepID=UPI00365323DF